MLTRDRPLTKSALALMPASSFCSSMLPLCSPMLPLCSPMLPRCSPCSLAAPLRFLGAPSKAAVLLFSIENGNH